MNDEKYIKYKNLIDEHVLEFLPEIDAKSITLYESIKYSLAAKGKRIRPILLLAACEFVGGDINLAIPYACALEYIHTYSLIHDDLPAMDDDDMRRGQESNHIKFGEAVAILAGDGLLTSAFEIMNKEMLIYLDDLPKLKAGIKAINEIAKGAGVRGMVAGQLADIEAENKKCSKEMRDYIHINKTGALITAAVRAGAYLGGVKPEELNALTIYAENLGLAFQVVDDILDINGNEELIGKKAGNDFKKKKATFPCLCGLESCENYLNELTLNAKNALAQYGKKAKFFNELADMLQNRVV